MNCWWRSWHGAPTDSKWLAIAQRTQTNAGMVSALAWALMDHASQSDPRGDVSTFDVEAYAAFSGFDLDKLLRIMEALTDKNIIKDNTLTAWEKRQPKREDGSAERAKHWRERKRTQPNANDRRVDKIRIDKKDISLNEREFEKFWESYPRKVAKKEAKRAFSNSLKETTLTTILAALAADAANWREERFIPYPATWLNGGRYLDHASQPIQTYRPPGADDD